MQWDDLFEKVLRGHLRYVADDEPIDADAAFVELGVDSMGSIELLADVEETFEIEFPDELLTPETFASPATLWAAVSSLRANALATEA